MTAPSPGFRFAHEFVRALAAAGLRHVCVSPGSRSTPLAVAFAVNPDIHDWVHHDERSSGFFAIGLARITAAPVAVVSTSGTAAAEFHPALAEARESRVPILALTADRPPELRGVGAPQTIDQIGLYGPTVKWSHDSAVPDDTAEVSARALATRAWLEATDNPAGPVHVNLPFREPLMEAGDATQPRGDGLPRVLPATVVPAEKEILDLAGRLNGKRILIVAGAEPDPAFPAACAALAGATGAPILADPLSGLRHGPHDRTAVVTTGDLLAGAGALDVMKPDVVLRFGALPTSKPIWRWLEDHPELLQIVVDATGRRDPLSTTTVAVRGGATPVAEMLAKSASGAGWLSRWTETSRRVELAVAEILGSQARLTEPGVARLVTEAAPSILAVASSMPIRDVDAFGAGSSSSVRYVANRGANGIDGLLSMAAGAVSAAGSAGIALAGDLSTLHDVAGLMTMARLNTQLTAVVIHNDGGGIFHFLPQAGIVDPEVFERHFGTPHGTDFVALARAIGIEAARVEEPDDLASLLRVAPADPRLFEVRTDRRENVELHESIRRETERVLAELR